MNTFTGKEAIEDGLASLFEHAINNASSTTDRAMQQLDHRLGMSDLGHCHEYVRRVILQEPYTDERDKMAAWVGSLLGAGVEEALAKAFPDHGWVFQDSIITTLPSGLQIPGHPDIYNPHLLIDLKSKDGLTVIEKQGQSQKNRFQLHGYAAGLIQAGKVDPDGFVVANVYVDRSGKGARPYVVAEPYDPQVVEQIDMWLEDSLYAVRAGEPAEKDPPRDFCERFCEFYTACRVYDTDVSGLLRSDDILTAAANIVRAQSMEREAKKLKDDARHVLDGVSGSTGTHFIRWTDFPATDNRRAYRKLEVRSIPQRELTDAGLLPDPAGPPPE